MNILHIAAHMGGGIGSAYAGLGKCGQEQTILLLERPIDLNSLTRVKEAGFRVLTDSCTDDILRELRGADVVLFDWTHHPALTRFLRDFPDIPIRSILWCHVSGNYFPHISADFVRLFDQSIFATPFSLELPQLQVMGDEYLKTHCDVVYGLNDLSRFFQLERVSQPGYTVGYVGTMGFCKLHPDFVDFCAAVGISDARFLMVGAPSNQKELLETAEKKGIAGQFQFCGQLPDVAPALAQMDVFGYPLNPQHFGATENALLEAMAAGLPVVALDQCVERGIVQDGKTGLLVHSPEEYGNAVRFLRGHPGKAAILGGQARTDVMRRYEIQANRRRFLAACQRTVGRDKHLHHFNAFFTGQPADWFLSAVKADRWHFEKGRVQDAGLIFHERTKGSPVHYHNYFPDDKRLALWAGQLSNHKEDTPYGSQRN